jgi:hypothetical protein
MDTDDKITNENRKDMYNEYEWEYNGEKRIGYKQNEKYFLSKAKNYKQMMINLSNMILKYKQEVIDTLSPYDKYIDKKTFDSLLNKIDDLYNYINGDSSHIKGVPNQLTSALSKALTPLIPEMFEVKMYSIVSLERFLFSSISSNLSN